MTRPLPQSPWPDEAHDVALTADMIVVRHFRQFVVLCREYAEHTPCRAWDLEREFSSCWGDLESAGEQFLVVYADGERPAFRSTRLPEHRHVVCDRCAEVIRAVSASIRPEDDGEASYVFQQGWRSLTVAVSNRTAVPDELDPDRMQSTARKLTRTT